MSSKSEDDRLLESLEASLADDILNPDAYTDEDVLQTLRTEGVDPHRIGDAGAQLAARLLDNHRPRAGRRELARGSPSPPWHRPGGPMTECYCEGAVHDRGCPLEPWSQFEAAVHAGDRDEDEIWARLEHAEAERDRLRAYAEHLEEEAKGLQIILDSVSAERDRIRDQRDKGIAERYRLRAALREYHASATDILRRHGIDPEDL